MDTQHTPDIRTLSITGECGCVLKCAPHRRLIAAAPEMLAALRAWVESTDATEQTGSMRPVYDAARTLLATIEGQPCPR